METKRKYSWRRDIPDVRDLRYALPRAARTLPTLYDMRPQCPKVYDQGELGSCTANASAFAFQFTELEQKEPGANPSRLFIYYNSREMMGTIAEDSGATLRDSIKSIANLGVCLESLIPYNVERFTRKPTKTAYKKALPNRISKYARVNQTLVDLKTVLAQNNPIVFGFAVYDAFESDTVARTGILTLPRDSDTMLGGHAVTLVGYDDAKKMFIVRNSWGPNWGLKGYFYMPYDYVLNADLSDDFWTISGVR